MPQLLFSFRFIVPNLTLLAVYNQEILLSGFHAKAFRSSYPYWSKSLGISVLAHLLAPYFYSPLMARGLGECVRLFGQALRLPGHGGSLSGHEHALRVGLVHRMVAWLVAHLFDA